MRAWYIRLLATLVLGKSESSDSMSTHSMSTQLSGVVGIRIKEEEEEEVEGGGAPLPSSTKYVPNLAADLSPKKTVSPFWLP